MTKREADFAEMAHFHRPPPALPGSFIESTNWPPERKKKKRSRWGGNEVEKAFIPGMPTVIPQGLNKDQEDMYLIQLQIEEISRRLRTGDLGIPPNPEERSPSPEPIYNSEGKRLNTREYRTRKKLEEERHQLVQRALSTNPEFKPPADYKPPVIRVSDKVMIPQEEHPDINFVGLLIGPRGNTLKNLEKETGAKIIIRGKGSVKEGKIGRKDGQPLPGEDEPLHAYVTANNPENVKKAVEKIKEIIRQGIEVPEGQNDLRRQQLRELALLNGTLRENDGLAKLKQLQQAQTIVTNTIICTVCGGTGHIAQDCKQKRPGDTFRAIQATSHADKAKMDSEYMSLMAELGEGPPPPKRNSPGPIHHSNMGHRAYNSGPPLQLMASPWSASQPVSKPPASITSLPPPSPLASQPPPMRHPAPTSVPSLPPPVATTNSTMMPPWQSLMSNTPPPIAPQTTSAHNMGVPPPNLMAPPPPPPPNSQTFPWQPQQQQGMVPPPPPPPSGTGMPPWQTSVTAVQGPHTSNMPPWQQHGPPPPVPAPPPPPPGGQPNFNPNAPPPPPPHMGSDPNQQMGLRMPGIPLGVPPPPPPN